MTTGNVYVRLPENRVFDFIHACNRINGMFGRPKIQPWWARGEAEEYPKARIIFTGDGTARVVSKTPAGRKVIESAARQFDIKPQPVIA